MKLSLIFSACVLLTSPQLGWAQAPSLPGPDAKVAKLGQEGRWIAESGNFEIDIAPCGAALCGTVTQVFANRAMSPGQSAEPVDKRSMLGMQILSSLQASGEQELSGEIYNRENGKTYKVRLNMDGAEQMLVRAYVGLPLFGKTQLWRRATPATPAAPAQAAGAQ